MDSGQHAGVRRPGIIRRFVNLVVCIAIVLAAAWGIRSFVIEPFEVPSASMETTIMTGDRLFAGPETDSNAGDGWGFHHNGRRWVGDKAAHRQSST